jgi:hypothetical protein
MTDRPHPYRPEMIDNPEWDAVLTRRAELYLAERARREDPEREPARMHIALGILGLIFVAAALIGALTQ